MRLALCFCFRLPAYPIPSATNQPTNQPTNPQAASRVAFSYTQSEFTFPISEPQPSVASLRLSDEQMSMHIDLGPYVNPSYYVVQEDASLSKVYTLFRTLGLRHLAVIPRCVWVGGGLVGPAALSKFER